MASSISGQDLELQSSFGSEGNTDLKVTENAGEQAISFNQRFLDSLASAPGSDKSMSAHACMCVPDAPEHPMSSHSCPCVLFAD